MTTPKPGASGGEPYRTPDTRDDYPVTRADFEAVEAVIFALEEKMGPLGNEHRRAMYAVRCSVAHLGVHYRSCAERAKERVERAAMKGQAK